jgi:hypothetical protein
MMSERHFEQDQLIGFVEGDVVPGLAAEIKHHLETCDRCRSYVESLRRAFAVLETDEVPEQSPGYWDFFEQRVRARAASQAGASGRPVRGTLREPAPGTSSGRRQVFSWVAGLAAAAMLLAILWWLPDAGLRGPGQTESGQPGAGMAQTEPYDVLQADLIDDLEIDPVDVLLADLSTGEIIESISSDPDIGLLLIEAEAEDIEEIDEYLAETTGLYDLVDQLSAEEQESFISSIKADMEDKDNTSGIITGSTRKGC